MNGKSLVVNSKSDRRACSLNNTAREALKFAVIVRYASAYGQAAQVARVRPLQTEIIELSVNPIGLIFPDDDYLAAQLRGD